MARCRCDPVSVAGCQCSVSDTNCINVSGAGTAASPFTFDPTLDPASNNLLTCGAAGLLAVLPAELASVPACRVTHSANQAIANDTNTILSMNTEFFDTDSMHSTVTNNSRVTFNTAGVYIVTGQATFDQDATGLRGVFVRINGITTIAHQRVSATEFAINALPVTATTIYKFAVSDYVELLVLQKSGGNLNVLAQGDDSPVLGAVRVAAG